MTDRVWTFQGQSPLTYGLMWLWHQMVGDAEWALRLLPVLFGIGTLFIMFEIGRYFGGRELGWLAVAVAVSLPELTYLTVSLRPYAFGFFFLTLSTYLLIRWLDGPDWRKGLAYAVSIAAAVWSAYFFALAFGAHLPLPSLA